MPLIGSCANEITPSVLQILSEARFLRSSGTPLGVPCL